MSSHLLERATALWKSGQKLQAHKLFEAIIYNDRCNEAAWIWYIYTLETQAEKISALENFLVIFPQHTTGKKALASLKQNDRQQLISTPPVEPVEQTIKNTRNVELASSRASRSIPKPKLHIVPWFLVAIGLLLLLFSTMAFIATYGSLQVRYQSMVANRDLISRNFEQLGRDYEALKSENISLTNEYNSLTGQYNSLKNEHSLLRGNYDSLSTEHNQLIEKYNALAGDYNVLDSIAIKPPYIFIHDRIVETTFYDTNQQLIQWSTPFSGLEYAIEKGDSTRQKMMDQGWYTTEVYTKAGKRLGIRDFSVFVTPEPFDQVMPDIYDSSASAYEFIFRTWNIIGQLSNYASEETETPRYPYETLLAGGGDCEDLSILFASLIKAAPVNWYVDLVYVDADNFLNPSKHNHVLVYIDTGTETFLVETTRDDVMLPYENGVVGWLAADLDSLDQGEYYPVYLR
jgi:hypothetical protein